MMAMSIIMMVLMVIIVMMIMIMTVIMMLVVIMMIVHLKTEKQNAENFLVQNREFPNCTSYFCA